MSQLGALPQSEKRAPTARNITARGKREAKRSTSPLVTDNKIVPALKGRNRLCYFGLSGLDGVVFLVPRGDALRFASRLPLAVIFRAVGAPVRL